MMIEGIDDFTDVTPILSPCFRSSMDLRCAARVFRYMGMELMAATPLTSLLPLVRSHKIRNDGGPADTKCADPDSNASIIADGPPSLAQSTVTLTPAFSACCSISLCFCIMYSGRKPKPPAPSGMRNSLTSARAAGGKAAATASNSTAVIVLMVSSLGVLPGMGLSRPGNCQRHPRSEEHTYE